MRTCERSITCLRKPMKLPGPAEPVSTAVVTPAGAAEFLGIDAERGAAPIDMGVKVDEPGRDDQAGDIAHLRGGI